MSDRLVQVAGLDSIREGPHGGLGESVQGEPTCHEHRWEKKEGLIQGSTHAGRVIELQDRIREPQMAKSAVTRKEEGPIQRTTRGTRHDRNAEGADAWIQRDGQADTTDREGAAARFKLKETRGPSDLPGDYCKLKAARGLNLLTAPTSSQYTTLQDHPKSPPLLPTPNLTPSTKPKLCTDDHRS
eukprot:g25314.t1